MFLRADVTCMRAAGVPNAPRKDGSDDFCNWRAGLAPSIYGDGASYSGDVPRLFAAYSGEMNLMSIKIAGQVIGLGISTVSSIRGFIMKFVISAVILFFSTVINANENNSYNQNIAIQMASTLTSDDRLVIYPIHDGVLFPIASAAIMKHLESAKKNKLALAILGPSYDVNYDSYKYAINNVEPGQYAGVRVIFIGDKNNFEELTTLSERAGISFKATTCCSK